MRVSIIQSLLFGAVCLSLVISSVAYFFAPAQMPIWYSLSIPEQQLDQKAMLFLFPVSLIVITIVHYFLGKKLSRIDTQLALIFSYATLMPLTVVLVAQIRIIVLTL